MTNGSTFEIPPAQRRWSMSRLLLWAVAIIVIGGMLISVMLPSLCKAREPANRVKCSANLRQIGLAISQYAEENGGHFPPSLAVLLKHADISLECLVCPSSNDERLSLTTTDEALADLAAAEQNAPGHKHGLSYVYVGGGWNAKTVPATAVLAYEPLENHNGQGANVLYGDGHVDWVDKRSWSTISAAAKHPVPATQPEMQAR